MAAVPAVAPAEAAGEPAGERVRKLLEIERLLARAEEGCVRRCDVSNAAAQLQAIRDEIDGELPAATNGSEGAPCPHDNVHEEMHRIISIDSRLKALEEKYPAVAPYKATAQTLDRLATSAKCAKDDTE